MSTQAVDVDRPVGEWHRPARAGAVLRVVHRHRGTLGVAFERLEDWGGILADVLRGFAGNAFGAVVPPRHW